MIVFADDHPSVSYFLKNRKEGEPSYPFYLCPQSIKAINELYNVFVARLIRLDVCIVKDTFNGAKKNAQI